VLEHRAPAKSKPKPLPNPKPAPVPKTKPTSKVAAQPAKPTTVPASKKPTPGSKATPKQTPKATPTTVKKWPKLKVLYPTKAVDLCYSWLTCERQDTNADGIVVARGLEADFVRAPQITPAPTSTLFTRGVPVIEKRARTFKPEFAKGEPFEFKDVGYPGAKDLYKKGRGKKAAIPQYHVIKFNSDHVAHVKVIDTKKEPTVAELEHLVTEHIIEVGIEPPE